MAEKKQTAKKSSAASSGGKSVKAAGSTKSTSSKKSSSGKKAPAGKKPKKHPAGSRMRDEIAAIFMITLGIFLLISVFTQTTGEFGEIFSMVLKGLFGLAAYILPFFLIVYGLLILLNRMAHVNSRSAFFSVLLFIDVTVLNSVRFTEAFDIPQSLPAFIKAAFYGGYSLESAGVSGMLLGKLLFTATGRPGVIIIGIAVAIVCVILIADTPVSVFFDRLREKRNKRLAERLEAEEYANEGNDEGNNEGSNKGDDQAYAQEYDKKIKEQAEKKKSVSAPAAFDAKITDNEKSMTKTSENGSLPTAAGGIPAQPENKSQSDGSAVQHASPFANLRIKGTALFKNNDTAKAREPDSFSDLPDNLRRIMNYVNDDELMSKAPENQTEDMDLNIFRAADFFHDIKNIPDMPEEPAVPQSSQPPHFQEEAFSEKAYEAAPDDSGFDEWLENNINENNTNENNIDSYNKEPDTTAEAQEAPRTAAAAAVQPQEAPVQKQLTRGEMRAAAAQGAADISASLSQTQAPARKEYKLPPISLLNPSERRINRNEQKELAAKAAKLEQVLQDFGVNAHVIDVKKGPSVTRYEIQPATGVKVSSITKLADDIALNLEAKSLRIEAPIPGKAAVGIEVENDSSSTVTMREMIESPEFENSKSKISFVVGEDISGNHVVADLKGMPHLLIAGSTGSGKSVCINSLIVSMLYRSTPDEVKFILIDPKVVELGNYNGIPHMLIPVVTDPSKAAAALAWAVQEMSDRYKKFAETSVRKLEEYNKKMEKENQPEKVLPQIVIIIDELADLMMAAAKQVEESICRLAQLARAAGMHLVVATQRPSVDVVTGLIKANIPSRIAFAVSSQVDSRTILDRAGAEKLVGKGDMLFSPLGKAQPERLQGPFVTDDEVTAVIDFWKEQADGDDAARRILEAINTQVQEVPDADGEEEDELLPEAVELVITSGQASASMLQRRYRIGYNRAGRLIDIMEARGIIGPSEGSRPRKVLISKEEYEARMSHAAAGADNSQEAAVYSEGIPTEQTGAQSPGSQGVVFSDDYGAFEAAATEDTH